MSFPAVPPFLPLLLLCGILFVPGCSKEHDYGPTGTIDGRLTMDGNPLPEGTKVMFMMQREGYLAYGLTDAEGNFTIGGWNDGNMPTGTYKVMLQPAGDDAEMVENMTPEEQLEYRAPKKKKTTDVAFPKRYRSIETSKLEYQVEKGPNTIPIDIQSK